MTTRLVADIGGTSSRFALACDGRLGQIVRLATASHRSFDDALGTALEVLSTDSIDETAIAAAGPRFGDSIDLTNVPWRIEVGAVSQRLGGAPVRLANDLEAVALALPHLSADDISVVQQGSAVEAPMITVNVGTGFGAAVAVRCRDGWTALAGEPGHMALGAMNDGELDDLRGMKSVEDVLSGPGLAALARRLGSPEGNASEILAAMDEASRKAATIFARLLGRIAGNLVLATGAWGGVYLCGGVLAKRRRAEFDLVFLESFGEKDKMAPLMKEVSVWRLTHENPALLGLAHLSL